MPRYTGPTPWKSWKKGQRWSLEPTAAEVAYYRRTIAENNPDLSRDEIEEGAIEAAQLARIDMAPKGSGEYEDWKTTGRYLSKMNALHKKRMASERKRKKRPRGISRAELDRLEASFKRGGKRRGGKKIRASGTKRSTVKAVVPKKLGRSKQPLFGKNFVLTGTLHATRGQVTKWIERSGGKVQSAVRASTTYVVKGAEPGDAKLSAAKKHKVPVITEGRLQRMMHEAW